MAAPSVHDITAVAFKALPTSKAVNFLATVTEPWMDDDLSDEVVLPDSYQVMFVRRQKQLAEKTGKSYDEVEALVLNRAREIRAQVIAAEAAEANVAV